jgi:hypothetical protein
VPNAWSGPDPTIGNAASDNAELGTEYAANADVTLTGIRIWASDQDVSVTNRKGHLWAIGGGLLATVTLPSVLPSGWSTYAFDTPVESPTGTHFVISYTTAGNYGVIIDEFAFSSVVSSDGALTAPAAGNSVHGNGVFNSTPGQFPNATFRNTFYGADVTYDIGIGGNTAPRITGTVVTVSDAIVNATVTAVDDQTLAGAQYHFDWGDGTISAGSSAMSSHTYTVTGTYAILMSVTDSGGLSAYQAKAVRVVVPPTSDFDRPVVATAEHLLATIVEVFETNNVSLPSRQVITVGTVAVDSPVLAVMYGGVTVGPPGNELNVPFRGDSPRTTTFNVELWREASSFGAGGLEPAADVVTAAAEITMRDSWLLLEAAFASDQSQVGIVANVTVNESQGERVGVSMMIEQQVP